VADFLDQWEHRLTNDSGCAMTYNRAVLAFFEGRFGECLRGMELVLRDFKDDVFYGTDARIYQIMSLFEIAMSEGATVELETRIHALRMYLTRENRIGENLKERYLNLVKQFRKLITLTTSAEGITKSKAEKFLQELDAQKPVSNRRWFEKQITQLIK
jgi:hypothetical protein